MQSASAATTEIELRPVEATFTTTRDADTPQNDKTFLSATHSQDASFLKFDTSSVNGKKIVSAELSLQVASTTASGGGVEVYPQVSSWSEGTLTAANRPGRIDEPLQTAEVRARSGQTIVVPLGSDTRSITTDEVTLELGYSQSFQSTTFSAGGSSAPTLTVTVQGGASSPSPTSTPTPTPTPTPTTSPRPSPTPTPTATPTPTPTPTPTSTTPVPSTGAADLPFALAGAGTTEKKVFAHYFTPYPISLDNRSPDSDYYAVNYLKASGEGGAWAESGGLLRDRPEGREPLSGDWRVKDMTTEVQDASDAGIDGFTIDILNVQGSNWDRVEDLVAGAEAADRDFTLVPNLDLTAPGVTSASVDTVAAKMAQLFRSSTAYRLDNGAYVLSSFAAERKSVQWWSDLKSTLASRYGMNTAVISVFLNGSDGNLAAYAPVSYALSVWGARTPDAIGRQPDFAAKAHALGVKWMAPVAVQDVRPRSFTYAEAANTETLRASWSRAIDDDADLVQLVTWNDYSESTSFAPSANHGTTFLDINAYYQTAFKNGSAPRITGDQLYLTHRVQFAATVPTTPQRLMTPFLGGASLATRDTVEVFTFLASPASVSVVVGGLRTTWTAPAGVSTKTVPLALGEVSASASRGGERILAVTSPYRVQALPLVQDLQYYGVGTRESD